jgi:hypothetical protein
MAEPQKCCLLPGLSLRGCKSKQSEQQLSRVAAVVVHPLDLQQWRPAQTAPPGAPLLPQQPLAPLVVA